MNKLTILKVETVLQCVITICAILYSMQFFKSGDSDVFFVISLFWIGIANIVGFLVRIFIIKSKFNVIYFFSVIAYFLFLAILTFSTIILESLNLFLLIEIFGVIFNIYYIIYGFILIKIWNQNA